MPPKTITAMGMSCVKKTMPAVKERITFVTISAAIEEAIVFVGKLFLFDLLVRKRFDNPHACQRIFHLRVDITDAVVASPQCDLHLLVEINRMEGHQRQEEKDKHGKPDVDREHDDERTQEVQ